MKAEGADAKAATRKIVDVPVDKAGLMEFLTFHNVNVVNPAAAPRVLTLDEMFAGDGLSPATEVTDGVLPPPPTPSVAPSTTIPLTELVEAAPLAAQLDLVVGIIDRASAAIRAS
jgi:hypothetical protein